MHFLQGPCWHCSWLTEAQRSQVACLWSQSLQRGSSSGLFYWTVMKTCRDFLGLTTTLKRLSWNFTSWASILQMEVLFLKSGENHTSLCLWFCPHASWSRLDQDAETGKCHRGDDHSRDWGWSTSLLKSPLLGSLCNEFRQGGFHSILKESSLYETEHQSHSAQINQVFQTRENPARPNGISVTQKVYSETYQLRLPLWGGNLPSWIRVFHIYGSVLRDFLPIPWTGF